jgi:K+-sensing histidine kinase KdpD
VDGDPARLAQLLTNLSDHASIYTTKYGDIALIVMVIGYTQPLTLTGNGSGIVAFHSVFEPFLQIYKHRDLANRP